MPEQKFFVNEDELDDYQYKQMHSNLQRSLIVSGCAGSGKSILALWKAKQIQNLEDGSSYKFIVFTRTLHQYMSDGICAIGLDDRHFYYYEQWKRQGFPHADFIIVDEIQDFERSQIAEFKKAADRAFLFWGDSAQSIYRNLPGTNGRPREVQDILSIAAEANIEPEKLCFNHRLPRKIARFAAHLTDDEELVQRCKKEGTEMPRILKYDTFEQQLDIAMQQIKNRQITDAAIMFPKNDDVKRAYDYLKDNKYSVEAKFDVSENGKHISRMDLDFDSDNPKLMTYHSAKGLQFEAVFLPERNAFHDNDRTPLYVAITRSYQYLFIMYSNARSHFFDVVPKNLYLTTIEDEEIKL